MRTLKRKLLLIMLVIGHLLAYGQSALLKQQSEGVLLGVVQMEQHNIPESVSTYLQNQLLQIVTDNGWGVLDGNARFVITASIVPLTKDVIPGPPIQYAENVNITFYIVDNIDQKVFSSITIPIKVVESSEEKALLKAVRTIDTTSPKLLSFINIGKEKIVAYYESQYANIVAKAKSLTKQELYEEALFELCMIPECCVDAYAKASEIASGIYDEYVDDIGYQYLMKAKSIWAAEQNAIGAHKAGQYLASISIDASCYSQAESLYKEIKRSVAEDLDFEMEVRKEAVSIEKQKVAAWKEVGVAYGKGQQQQTTHITWLH